MSTDVGIMVVAQRIEQATLDRFSACVAASKPKCSYTIHFLSTRDPNEQAVFNKSKLLNTGIRTLTPLNYTVLIQADVDLIVPPGLIDRTLVVGNQPNTCFYNHHIRIAPDLLPVLPEGYKQIHWIRLALRHKPEHANGCWNGMRPETWLKSGGYNEWMTEWGNEDDEFRRRCGRKKKITFIDCREFPLIHYNHPPRTKVNAKKNREMEIKAWKEDKLEWI